MFAEDVLLQVNFRTHTGMSYLSVKDVRVHVTLPVFKRAKICISFGFSF